MLLTINSAPHVRAMSRPSRVDLLGSFFPELVDKDKSKNDRKASAKFATLAAELVLVDQIKMFDKGLKSYGPGALCVRCQNKKMDCEYLPVSILEEDQEDAQTRGDTDIHDTLKKGLELVGNTNFDKKVILMLVDDSRFAFYPVTRDFPAKDVQAMLEDYV